MKNQIRALALLMVLLSSKALVAQTSWRGTTNSDWGTASNWTAGVPGSTTDVIIGDANFTGANQPSVNSSSNCRSLTLGGVVGATLTINRTLAVGGNVTINSNGTIFQNKTSFSLSGNWSNSGTYTANSNGAQVNFNGTAQVISGSSVTTFRKLIINAGSTVTLANNCTVGGSGSLLTVNGTLNPGESPTYQVTATGLTVNSNATLKVNASSFGGNYAVSGTVTLNAGSTVDYSATALNQTISNTYTYATLRISGSGTKTLGGNLPALNASSAGQGNIHIASGTLDLAGFTANRGTSVAGGTLSLSNGAVLRIGGTSSFPLNFSTTSLSLTSTVEYYGGAQSVGAHTYGNLTLTGASGNVVKNLPASEFTVSGNFSMTAGTASSVAATAAANINITGNLSLGTNTTFDGGSNYTHRITGNWVNNGILTGNSSTFVLNGSGSTLGGSGSYNFFDLTIVGSTNVANADLTVSGNLSTTGSGSLLVSAGRTLAMNGTSKSISGTGITIDNLAVSGSVSTAASFNITGNVNISGSLLASNGTITMSGTGKSISNSGTLAWSGLSVSGTVATSASFSVGGALIVGGSFTASSPSTITFAGNSSLNGTANLFNATVNGTSFQLSSNAVLGIAGSFLVASGIFNVTSTIPNTVNYNGTASQSVAGVAYHHLRLSNVGAKSAANAITVNGDLTIAAGSVFTGGSFTHVVRGHWTNNGSFNAGAGTIRFEGAADATISGETTFNAIDVSKSSASNQLSMLSNITTHQINMNTGTVQTTTNTLTITGDRTGNGVILGIIKREHAFVTGLAYAFESPANTIYFSAVSSVTSVTVRVRKGAIADFPFGAAINRVYEITVPSGSYNADLRLHYEDAELNGTDEDNLHLWQYNGTTWIDRSRSSNNTLSNFVELAGLTNMTNRWTLSNFSNVVRWTGAASNAWSDAANWSAVQGAPSLPPSSADIVEIGFAPFTNQPQVAANANAKNILLGSNQAVTLTVASGGSLTVAGNINGEWLSGAVHSLANDGTLTINGDLVLGDGVNGNRINFGSNAGTTTVAGSVTQTGNASVSFSGNAVLNIGDDYNYHSGSFAAGASTINYNGSLIQTIAPFNYHNLSVSKTGGVAQIAGITSVGNTLAVNGGELDIIANTAVSGNVVIAPGASVKCAVNNLSVAGNWSNSGSFLPGTGAVLFNGTGTQSISASTFNQILISKASGTAQLTGSVTVNGDLVITSGSLNLGSFSANRASSGGSLVIHSGASLLVGGAANFPSNYSVYDLDSNSNVYYNGTVSQSVAGTTYGHLYFSNAGAKSLAASATVHGNLTINSGASFTPGAYTVALRGNWVNNGNFNAASSTFLLMGTNKTISGNTTFHHLSTYGSYTVLGSDITFVGSLRVLSGASLDAGGGQAIIQGDLTNSGTLTSNGITTFTGAQLQTIRLLSAISSNSSGVINFNGTVSPVLNSTSTPVFATLNINNTGGINPSVNWTVFVAFNVSSGAVFNGGTSTHSFLGAFTNNGTVTSSGVLNISPLSPQTVKLAGTAFSSTGLVVFGGNAAVSVTGTPTTLTDVTITNAAGVTPANGWNIARDFNIGSNGLFNAGANSYTVGGDLQSDGRLNGGTSTFTLSASSGQISGSDATNFHHLNITGANITVNSSFNLTGNLSTSGTLDATLAEVQFTGANNATISGSATSLAQFAVNKNAGSSVSLARNVTAITYLKINSGILDQGTYSLTQDALGGNLNISNGATLRIGGTNSLPVFSTYALDTLSIVEYNGTTQSISNATSYGSLTLSASGTKTAAGALVLLGNFSLSNASFSAGSNTHSIGGHWQMTSGTYTNTGNTILLNGAGNQTVASTGAFNNLTVNKTAGLAQLGSAITINGVLSLTNGRMELGSHNLTMGSSASIANAGSTNYIIAEGAGALIRPVGAGASRQFPVGRAAAYLPATITLTAGSTADNFSVRLLSAPYRQGMSGDAVTEKAVNASWVIGEAVAGGSDATVLLQWPGSLELNGFARNLSRLARYNGSMWDYGPSDIAASGSNPYTVARGGFTSLTVFAVSSFEALPVTWLSFSGMNVGKNNQLNWSTASEQNNSYFSVETSGDGRIFYEIGRVTGAQNSSTVQQYQFIHNSVTTPTTFYRLKQVDIDGRYSYSRTIMIRSSLLQQVTGYFSGNELQLVFSAAGRLPMSLQLFDASGRQVLHRNVVAVDGANYLSLSTPPLPGGIYWLHMEAGGTKQVLKIRK